MGAGHPQGPQTPLTFREERKCASVQESPPPPPQQRRTHYVNNSQLQHLQHSGNNNEQQPTPRGVEFVVCFQQRAWKGERSFGIL
ncbi:hypothetical protein CY35_10G006700 [Sphagnum magellanicum]|nr:hypothetical protein CY35_10G006700 [Sphagnum magellanicum]